MLRYPAILIVGAAAVVYLGGRKVVRLTSHGTARWADADDLERAGLLSDKPGLLIGRIALPKRGFFESLNGLFDRRVPAGVACERFVYSMRKLQRGRQESALVRLSNAVHIAVFAPTGVGKGVSCVIPHLLNSPRSMVVIDFKGENYQITARHRQERFGHKTVVLDPFTVVTQSPDTFNPLDSIDPKSPQLIDECRALANAMVIRTGEEKDPYWNDSAELWITAIIVAVTLYGRDENRSLQAVRTLLTDPAKREAIVQVLRNETGHEGMVARLGNQLTNFKDKELGSVLSTANRFMNFLDTPAIAASTRSSSFDLSDLRKGRMTLYLVLPPKQISPQAGLLRLWVGAALRAVVDGGLQEQNAVDFILDEAASLGRMDCLDDAVDKYRGYGVRLQFYYQSMGQLRKCWGEGGDTTLISNTTQVFFGVNDQQTSEFVSSRLGESTIVVDSGGTNNGGSRQVNSPEPSTSLTESWGSNANWSQQARKLLKPEEVVALPARTAITFTPGVPPIQTTLTRYFEELSPGNGRRSHLLRMAEVWLTAILLLATAAAAGLAMAGM
ncbi:type IV secretory system conjugative DNA transfer family protein [Tautonia marina]|uniref:type IV secretory system conjugative DNA transfer family protein n=1 Tax=Tautonia marina TaxID=2653855 RepID=UPI0013761E82|nr:type IV secretory system conjugative DNA transfer family protein [Tautonia marina]